MPYLYVSCEPEWSSMLDAMEEYLNRSGINLRCQLPTGGTPETAVRLVLHRRPRCAFGAAIYYTPAGASVRFAYCLNQSLRQLPFLSGKVCTRAGAIGGRLRPTGVPTVLTVFGSSGAMPADPLGRAFAQATAAHFRLPPICACPEASRLLQADSLLLHIPRANAESYHWMPCGSSLSILGETGDYALVRHEETVGFVPKMLLSS